MTWTQFKKAESLGNITTLCKRIGVRQGTKADITAYLRNSDQTSLAKADDSHRGKMKVEVGEIGQNQVLEDLVFQPKEFKLHFVSHDSH